MVELGDLKIKMNLFTAQVSAKATNAVAETPSELANLFSAFISKIPLWIGAIVLMILTFFVARIIRSSVENKIAEKGIEDEHKEIPILAGRTIYAAAVTIGITASLKVAGIDITSIIAAIAFGLGFALKDLIMNFIAGIMILMARQFTIGDFIKVGETKGKIIEIQSRATVLKSFDGTKIVVPNSQLFTDQVTSYTSNPFRRIEACVGVDYRGDLENAIKLCMETAIATPGVLAIPKPAVMVTGWGDYEIEIKVRAWVESRSGWLRIRSDLYRNIKQAYNDYNIQYAWPITQLVMDKEMQADSHEKMIEGNHINAESLPVTSQKPSKIEQPTGQDPNLSPEINTLLKESEEMDNMEH